MSERVQATSHGLVCEPARWPVWVLAACVVALSPGVASRLAAALLLLLTCPAYGLILHRLGRRGYLPISMDFEE